MESPRRSRLWARTVAHGEVPMQEQGIWRELLPVGDTCWSSLVPVVWTHIGAILESEGSLCWINSGGTASCERHPVPEQGEESICEEVLWTDCNPHSPQLYGGRM